MPWLIRLILIISVFDFLIACVGAAALLTGILEPGRSTVPPLTVTAVLLVSGTLGYGIAMEHRYPRPLATIAFAAQPFASGEFSWRVAISSILCLVVAVWFLYWNDKITDYYIILSDHARERHRSLVRSG